MNKDQAFLLRKIKELEESVSILDFEDLINVPDAVSNLSGTNKSD